STQVGQPIFGEDKMKCAICRNGHTENGFTSVILERKNTTLVFKRVPAQICDNCGEEYISSEVNRKLLRHARDETDRGITLELLEFAA
ncbi:MAG: type II toxin-antitoxin system MqsA family antitoxin, partial [Desulfobacteraceae bacterium]